MVSHAQKASGGKGLAPFFGLVAVFALCLGLLGGCGKRPSQVDAPDGAPDAARIYPDPATDPAP